MWYENEMLKTDEKYIKRAKSDQKEFYLQNSKDVDKLSTKTKENRQNLCNQMTTNNLDLQSIENQGFRDSSELIISIIVV